MIKDQVKKQWIPAPKYTLKEEKVEYEDIDESMGANNMIIIIQTDYKEEKCSLNAIFKGKKN